MKVKGALYVSPMPFGPYDQGNRLLKSYKKKGIELAVVLVTDEEIQRKAKGVLLTAYEKADIKPIRFPITDYTSPNLDEAAVLIDKLSGYLRAGSRIVVHCNAGVGRTAVIVACIVQDVMNISADEAIVYIKEYMQTNMTNEQIRLVQRFQKLEPKLS